MKQQMFAIDNVNGMYRLLKMKPLAIDAVHKNQAIKQAP